MRRLVVFAAAFVALSLSSLNFALAGGGMCTPPPGATEGKGIDVKLANCAFLPTIIHAPVGATVTWFNGDYLPHAVNGLGWNATGESTVTVPGVTVPGKNLSHTFSQPGIYPYMCYLHPGMSGIVVVGGVALNPNADGTTTTAATVATAQTPSNAQSANAASAQALAAERATAPTVELPIALVLAALAATLGYAFAMLPRYRLLSGALAIRRRLGVHAR